MTTQPLLPELSIDLEVEGFQVGAFSVICATESQPDRVHQIPLCIFKQNTGPVVCLISGVQRGDVSGTTVLQNLVQNIDIKNIQGTLIVCASFTSASTQNRWSRDERNAIKHSFTQNLLDAADVIIDIGSGSGNTMNSPHVSIWPSEDEASNDIAESLMFAMGAPDSVRRFDEPLPHSFADYAKASNTTYLRVELGHFNTTDKSSRLMGIAQCQNALLHTGILSDGHFQLNSTRILETGKAEYKIQTPTSGLIHWHVELGGNVHRGNPIAHIFDPYNPFAEPICIDAKMNGVLLTKFSGAYCTPDNLLAVVADEVPR